MTTTITHSPTTMHNHTTLMITTTNMTQPTFSVHSSAWSTQTRICSVHRQDFLEFDFCECRNAKYNSSFPVLQVAFSFWTGRQQNLRMSVGGEEKVTTGLNRKRFIFGQRQNNIGSACKRISTDNLSPLMSRLANKAGLNAGIVTNIWQAVIRLFCSIYSN